MNNGKKTIKKYNKKNNNKRLIKQTEKIKQQKVIGKRKTRKNMKGGNTIFIKRANELVDEISSEISVKNQTKDTLQNAYIRLYIIRRRCKLFKKVEVKDQNKKQITKLLNRINTIHEQRIQNSIQIDYINGIIQYIDSGYKDDKAISKNLKKTIDDKNNEIRNSLLNPPVAAPVEADSDSEAEAEAGLEKLLQAAPVEADSDSEAEAGLEKLLQAEAAKAAKAAVAAQPVAAKAPGAKVPTGKLTKSQKRRQRRQTREATEEIPGNQSTKSKKERKKEREEEEKANIERIKTVEREQIAQKQVADAKNQIKVKKLEKQNDAIFEASMRQAKRTQIINNKAAEAAAREAAAVLKRKEDAVEKAKNKAAKAEKFAINAVKTIEKEAEKRRQIAEETRQQAAAARETRRDRRHARRKTRIYARKEATIIKKQKEQGEKVTNMTRKLFKIPTNISKTQSIRPFINQYRKRILKANNPKKIESFINIFKTNDKGEPINDYKTDQLDKFITVYNGLTFKDSIINPFIYTPSKQSK
jgi:hypothetical protein